MVDVIATDDVRDWYARKGGTGELYRSKLTLRLKEFDVWIEGLRLAARVEALRAVAVELGDARGEVFGNRGGDGLDWRYMFAGVDSAIVWIERYADELEQAGVGGGEG